MAEVMIRAGAVADIPTRAEMAEDIRAAYREHASEDAKERQQARGIKPMRVALSPAAAPSSLLVPDGGPLTGYIWAVRLVSVQLNAQGTCQVYIVSSSPPTGTTPNKLIADSEASGFSNFAFRFSKGQALLMPGESVWINANHGITGAYLAAVEAPAEMIWKLL